MQLCFAATVLIGKKILAAVSNALAELVPSRGAVTLVVVIGVCTVVYVGPPRKQEEALRNAWTRWVPQSIPIPAQVLISLVCYGAAGMLVVHISNELPIVESVCAGLVTIVLLQWWHINTLKGSTDLFAKIDQSFNILLGDLAEMDDADSDSDDHDTTLKKEDIWPEVEHLRDDLPKLPGRYFDTSWSGAAGNAFGQWMLDSGLESRAPATTIPKERRDALHVIAEKYADEFTKKREKISGNQ